MRKAAIVMMFLSAFSLIGCTSVPSVKNGYREGEGKYRVSVAKGYQVNQREFDYAINSFVLQQGGDSYDVERIGSSVLNDFLITIPGDTPVIYNQPEVRHFHKGKTIGLVVGISIPGIIILAFLLATIQANARTRL
ncbi:MAG: hypothetical protein LBG95_09625 [Treponema sp.]|nr:hypothetical protein [Treponema sp.]